MTKTKAKKTTKRMPKSKREEFIDPQTGQPVERYTFEYEERDANFHKLWLWHIAAALELIGNQKIRILSYILENTRNDNLFIGTQQSIADATETAYQTVSITIKMLIEADILKMTHPACYQINPEVIFKGGSAQRLEVLYQYHGEKPKKGAKKQ